MLAASLQLAGRVFTPGEVEAAARSLADRADHDVRSNDEPGILVAWRGAKVVRGEGRPTVLFDGELHDRDDLAGRLGVSPLLDDAELYREAWSRLGEDCDAQLNGRYAALVIDAGMRTLRCAASPIEAPPLHWARHDGRLLVASTPLALFALGVPRRLDWTKFDDALVGHYGDPSRGWFEGIGRVPPGTLLRLDDEGAHSRQFWSMDAITVTPRGSHAEVVEEAEALLGRGIAAAMTGFARPALSLSGGLDSQIVAAMVAKGAAAPVPAFCAVPQGGYLETPRRGWFGDEGPYARALCERHPMLELHPIDAAGRWFGEEIDGLIGLGALPPANAGNLPLFGAIMQRAAEAGCDVLLHGGNGNLTLSHDGMDGFSEWPAAGARGRAVREALRLQGHGGLVRRLLAFVVKPALPRAILRRHAGHRAARDDRFSTWCAMRADHAQRSGALARAQAALSIEQGAGIATRADRLGQVRMAMAEGGDLDLTLERAHGIALRCPLSYRPFVEFCLSLPAEHFLAAGIDRRLARDVGRGRIPEPVRTERRRGLQGADWPTRLAPRRGELLRELDELAREPELSRRIDFARLRRDLAAWDGADTRGSGSLEAVGTAIPQAIVLARFARHAGLVSSGADHAG